MNLAGWIMKELRLRKANAALLAATVAVGAAAVCGTLIINSGYETAVARSFSRRREALEKEMKTMWNEYRKMTKDLGFNVLILPEKQNVADFYAEDFSSQYMPESYAEKLASSQSITVQHILPALMQKTFWPERGRSVLVYGVRGELSRIHFPEANKKSPILQPVKPGTAVCGYQLCRELGLSPGTPIVLHGKTFTVEKCHEQRGNRDDNTIWIDLATAQEMFGRKDSINSILALECRCIADSSLPNIAKIRKDLETVLPGTRVLEFMSAVIARAEARYEAHRTGKETLAAEMEDARNRGGKRRRMLAGILLAVIGAVLLVVGLLTYANTRSRLGEFGVLRAIGFSSGNILLLVGMKLAVLAITGVAAGIAVATVGAGAVLQHWNVALPGELYRVITAGSGAGVVLLSIVAGAVPVIQAVAKTPATLLGK